MAVYVYECDECGWEYELTWRPEHKYGPNYKQLCGRSYHASLAGMQQCGGTLKRVYSTFNFRVKGEMGR
jgi:predicted nucleic acid-binding Zn ribbon protein